MKRRKFLISGLGSTLTAFLPFGLARLLAPELQAREANHLLPPGALKNRQEFNTACIGCGVCEHVCPVQNKPAVYVTNIGETRSRTNQIRLGSS